MLKYKYYNIPAMNNKPNPYEKTFSMNSTSFMNLPGDYQTIRLVLIVPAYIILISRSTPRYEDSIHP